MKLKKIVLKRETIVSLDDMSKSKLKGGRASGIETVDQRTCPSQHPECA